MLATDSVVASVEEPVGILPLSRQEAVVRIGSAPVSDAAYLAGGLAYWSDVVTSDSCLAMTNT